MLSHPKLKNTVIKSGLVFLKISSIFLQNLTQNFGQADFSRNAEMRPEAVVTYGEWKQFNFFAKSDDRNQLSSETSTL